MMGSSLISPLRFLKTVSVDLFCYPFLFWSDTYYDLNLSSKISKFNQIYCIISYVHLMNKSVPFSVNLLGFNGCFIEMMVLLIGKKNKTNCFRANTLISMYCISICIMNSIGRLKI